MLTCSGHDAFFLPLKPTKFLPVSWPFVVSSAQHVLPLHHHLGFTQMLPLQRDLLWPPLRSSPPHTTAKHKIILFSIMLVNIGKLSLLSISFLSLLPQSFSFFPYYFLYSKTPLPFPFSHRGKHSNVLILYLFILYVLLQNVYYCILYIFLIYAKDIVLYIHISLYFFNFLQNTIFLRYNFFSWISNLLFLSVI